MDNNEEENNNESKQERNQIKTKPNESIEMKESNQSIEKEKEKTTSHEEIKYADNNNLVKSLTEKDNQKKDRIFKNTYDTKQLNPENNLGNGNDDLTNIKYVTEKQLDQLNKEQKNKENNKFNDKNAIITIKDLQKNPNKKLLINSPRSLKALYDSGYSLEKLYYKTLDEFIEEHKDLLHLDEESRINRYHFYEQLRMDKINSLVEYREKIIQDEIDYLPNNINNINKNEEIIEIKPMKEIILDNDKRIAQEEIDIITKKHEKELANIIQLELDKDLFNIEMKKQQENYAKEYEKLNFLNFKISNDNELKNEEEQTSEEQKTMLPIPLTQQSEINVKNTFKSFSLPKKRKIFVDSENKYLDNLHTLQQTLINQKYEKRQKKVQQKLERLEKVKKIMGEQRALKKRIGVERAAQNLQKNATDFNRKHDDLVREIQNKRINIYQNKQKFQNTLKNKNELNHLKYLVKMDIIENMKRKDENLRIIQYVEIMKKQSRVERIKNERNKIVDNKLFQKDYLNKERKNNITKINQILNTGINEDNLDKLIKNFPNNKDLQKVVNNYKDNKIKLMNAEHKITTGKAQAEKRPKSQGKLYLKLFDNKINNDLNDKKILPSLNIPNILYNNQNEKVLTETNKVSYESDIEEKIKLYKDLLYKQFYEKVQKERENEEMRLKELEKLQDKNEKYQLEKKFRKERAIVFMRLERENQKLNEKIKMYELNLKNVGYYK